LKEKGVVHSELDGEQERLLILRAGNDPAAFQLLYEAYFQRVYNYAAARVNDQLDAEDIVSDVFLQVIKGLNRLKNRHQFSFAAWVFTIARNAVADFYRRQNRNMNGLRRASAQINNSRDTQIDEIIIEQEEFYELVATLSQLSERRREIVLLKYFGGLRNQEIAQVLELDERTVASHLSRALKDLHEAYRKQRADKNSAYDQPEI
jgi:RNA polymerase sigma-70 factor (ECF subfamily)